MQTKCPVFHDVLPTFSDCLLLKQAVLAASVSAGVNVLCYDWLTPLQGKVLYRLYKPSECVLWYLTLASDLLSQTTAYLDRHRHTLLLEDNMESKSVCFYHCSIESLLTHIISVWYAAGCSVPDKTESHYQ